MIALVRRSGPLAGQRIEVTADVVLGREASLVDVAIDDPEVSRRHLVLRPRPDGIELEDLRSHNGTLLDGVRLTAPVTVRRSARVTIGNTTLELELEPSPAPAPPRAPAALAAVPAVPDRASGTLVPNEPPVLVRTETALDVGDVVGGRFELKAKLGEGGMSRVYEALDRKYDRPAAVKVLGDWMATDIEFRMRFEREATAAERVTHPHVLPVWDHGEHDHLLYLATPLCDTDLAGLLVREGRLEPARALAVIGQIAWALDWAHDRGVVHRDVKPDNIFLVIGPGGDHAYLADFGLAKAKLDATLTLEGRAAGFTPDYAAPEQWLGLPAGPRADQYALAATLHTCVAGRPPFRRGRGGTLREAHMDESPPLLTEMVDGVPPSLAAAVIRGMAKKPAERYATCGELVVAARSEHVPAAAAPPDRPRVVGRRRARRVGIATAGLAVVAGAVVAVLLATGGKDSPTPAEPGAVQQLPVGPDPIELTADTRRVWVANHGGGTVTRIAASGASRRRNLSAVAQPVGVAVAGRRVWVAGPDGVVAALDARTGRRLSKVKLRLQVDGMAAAFGALWTFNSTSGTVTRLAVTSGRLGRPHTVRVGVGTSDIVAGPGGVWVANRVSATLVQLVPATGAVARTVRLRHAIEGVALDGGTVWTTSPTEGRIVRVGAASRRAETFPVAPAGAHADVAAGDGAVFYVNQDDGTAARVDPATARRIGRPVGLVTEPGGAVVAAHALWVADRARGTVARLPY